MLIRKFIVILAMAFAPATVLAEEVDNPYKRAEKGQWANYKLTIKAGGQDIAGTVKQTVTAKDDKSVTLEVVSNVGGMEQTQKQTIDLTKPFNPLANANLPMGANSKVEKKESGKEEVDAGGKKVPCEWTNYKTEAEANGLKLEGEIKVWLSKELPIGGLAKMKMKMMVAGMEIEALMEMEKTGKN